MHTGSSSSGGWDRPIKYNLKEYMEYVKGVSQLIERLDENVKAVDVERVGWVLGREKAVIVRPGEDDASAAKPSKRSRNADGDGADSVRGSKRRQK